MGSLSISLLKWSYSSMCCCHSTMLNRVDISAYFNSNTLHKIAPVTDHLLLPGPVALIAYPTKTHLKQYSCELSMLIIFFPVDWRSLRFAHSMNAQPNFGQYLKASLRDLIAATALVILLKLDSNPQFFSPYDLEVQWMTSKNNREPLLYYVKLCASFQSHRWIQTGVKVWKRSILVKIGNWWPRKTIGHLS